MMPYPQNNIPRIWTLTNVVCEGTISEQELRELELLLEADPDAKEFYVDFLNINAEISWLVSAKQHSTMDLGPRSPVDALIQPERPPILGFLGDWANFFNQHSPLSFILLFVALGMTLFATSYWLTAPPSAKAPAEPVFVAQITATKDCQWSTTIPPRTGTMQLRIGQQLRLEQGIAQITYSNQAEVLLEGPASFTVDTVNSGFLSRGKLTVRAESDESRQFAILTPQARFVDLGTEFGVMIDDKGRSAIAVFAGKVKAEAKLSNGRWTAPLALCKGEAVVCEGAKFTPQVASRSDFPTLQPPPPAPRDPSYQRWLYVSQELQKRPDLLAYYDFQPDPSNPTVLLNRASTGAALNGEIQNATWVDGRFPGKSALEFTAKDTGVRINIPAEYRQMTLIAWINSKQFANKYNCILFSDGWNQAQKLHWQIRNNGQFEFSVYGLKGYSFTEGTFPEDCLGRWCMVAGVIEAPDQSILYLNGEFFEKLVSKQMPPAKIGWAMIGGWNDTDSPDKNDTCSLSGRMDELMIFQTALTADEIKRIYEAGKP
jgi:hypothetical protein